MSRAELARNFADWIKTASLREMSTLCLVMGGELIQRGEPGASHLAAASRALEARIAQHNAT
jgi:hypothetical protein